MEEFRDLEVLGKLHLYPVKKKRFAKPNYQKCAELLETVFTSDSIPAENEKFQVPLFTVEEMSNTLKSMRKGRCKDKMGVALEMFLFGGPSVLEHLVEALNMVLLSNEIPKHWCGTFFLLLHKGGVVHDPNNWRPIGILSIAYKIFARAIYYIKEEFVTNYTSINQKTSMDSVD